MCVTQDLELPDAKSTRALNARGNQLARAAIKRVRSAHSLQRGCVCVCCAPLVPTSQASHAAQTQREAEARSVMALAGPDSAGSGASNSRIAELLGSSAPAVVHVPIGPKLHGATGLLCRARFSSVERAELNLADLPQSCWPKSHELDQLQAAALLRIRRKRAPNSRSVQAQIE